MLVLYPYCNGKYCEWKCTLSMPGDFLFLDKIENVLYN